jgi:cysteine desulfurase/selenocysteine lyase
MYGPKGVGVLWGRAALLDAMPPWQGGGGMVTSVDASSARYREVPARFEAGTPNVAGIVGLAAAVRYLRALGDSGEARIHARLVETIAAAGARILGAPELAVVSFVMPGVHAHDVASIADGEGVALRSGHHCAQPLHRRLGADASTRASVACYSGDDDVDALAAALRRVREVFR